MDISDFTFADSRIRSLSRLINALSADLLALQQGRFPTLDQLADAPVITEWALGYRPEPALVGRVSGHPRVADGPAVTSGLYYLDPDLGFARTLSRYYILGEPRTNGQSSPADTMTGDH